MSKTSAAAAKALTSSHFELFGLPPAFSLDLSRLDAAYRDIQSQVHPDRYAHAGDAERRASMQMTTRVNEAYRTLKSPVRRAKYLLELNGVDLAFETDTTMPQDFLVQQLEFRERLAEARTVPDLDLAKATLLGQETEIERQLAEQIDVRKDLQSAKTLVRKLMFFERLDGEIDAAYEALET
jgi:molecular chaperone HscB